MKDLLTNDLVVRALKTFIQAFLSVVVLGVADVVDWNTAKALLLAGIAGGISAVWNTIITVKK